MGDSNANATTAVLADGAAQPQHDVVVRRGAGLALLQRHILFDDPLCDRRDSHRIGSHARLKLGGKERARRKREHEHRDHGRREKRQEQLSIEAGANLAQQLASRGSGRPAQRRHEPPERHQCHIREPDERGQLGEVDQMIDFGDDRIPEDVNPDAVVLDVGRERPVSIAHLRPERLARLCDPRDERFVDRPRPGG